MLNKFQLERIPRFLDDVDSAAFALRTIWMGYPGRALRSLVLFLAVLAGSGLSPVFRAFVIAVVATFMFAELAYLACGRPPLRGVTRPYRTRS